MGNGVTIQACVMVSTIPINSPAYFATARQEFGLVGNQRANTAGELSSGRRNIGDGNDPASVTASLRLRAQIVELEQSSRNVAFNDTLVSVASTALTEIQGLLAEAATLAAAANSLSQPDAERAFGQQQLTDILTQIDTIAADTTFDGRVLLNGDFDGETIRVGGDEDDLITLAIPDASTSGLFSGSLPDISSQPDAATAESQIAAAQEIIETAIGDNNGIRTRLLTAESNVRTTLTGLGQARESLENIDVEEVSIDFALQQVQVNIGASVLAQTQQLSSDLLSLLSFRISDPGENTGQEDADDGLNSAQTSPQSSAENNASPAQNAA